MTRTGRKWAAAVSLVALTSAGAALAQDEGLSYSLWGSPGLVDMPNAVSATDATIAGTVAWTDAYARNSFTFQMFPRMSGTFRYSNIQDFYGPTEGTYFDRSFDLSYRLLDEGDYRPSVVVGLRDFLGTGLYSSEYIVATKTLGDSVRVTAGLGWGRMASHGGFENPLGVLGDYFKTRPALDYGTGGNLEPGQYFRGDAALFGGIEWAATDNLTVKAEYSSDAYLIEQGLGTVDYRSPVNLGLVWYARPGIQLSFNYLHGSTFGITATATLNPNQRPLATGFDRPPPPVGARDSAAAASWGPGASAPPPRRTERLAAALDAEGITLDAIELSPGEIRLRYTNRRYRAEAQGLGRVARVLSREVPGDIDRFVLEPQQAGIPMVAVALNRDDIEALENEAGSSAALFARAQIGDAGRRDGLVPAPQSDPLSWKISGYSILTFFGKEDAVNLSAGVQVSGRYQIRPNMVIDGLLRQELVHTAPDFTPYANDDNPNWYPVRRNSEYFLQEGVTAIERLTFAWFDRPGPDLYSRVTAGYLERQFGGVSAELLWAPVDSRLSLGAEVDWVRQRDFDGGFGFRDYEVVSGHVSAYYELTQDFYVQLDAGRYLAGDWGATFTLEREFDNGWRVGAYATLTNMSFEDYGLDSFQKGIIITIPLDYFAGTGTRATVENTLASHARDGGARVNVQGRLYDTIRSGHMDELAGGWGRFWR